MFETETRIHEVPQRQTYLLVLENRVFGNAITPEISRVKHKIPENVERYIF